MHRFIVVQFITTVLLFVMGGAFPVWAQQIDATTPRLVAQVGHAHGITAVGFSPDGQQVLTGDGTGRVKLWDAETGTEIRVFDGHQGRVNEVTFSPNGKWVATAGSDSLARLWSIETGYEMRVFRWHSHMTVKSVAFSPNDRHVLTGGGTGGGGDAVRLWDVETGEEIRVFEGPTALVETVAFSPNGNQALAGSRDGKIWVWDVESGTLLRSLGNGRDSMFAMVFSTNANLMLAGDISDIRMWNLESEVGWQKTSAHSDTVVSAVAISKNGSQALTGGWDDKARLWDAKTGEEVRTFEGHTDWVTAVGFSPDGRYVLTGSADATVRLWDAGSGVPLQIFKGSAHAFPALEVPVDQQQFLTGSYEGFINKWNLESGEEIESFQGHSRGVLDIDWSPDGQQILTGGVDNTARLWDAGTGEELQRFEGHDGRVNAVAFSADGRWVVTASADSLARLWRAGTGEAVQTFEGHTDWVTAVGFSLDGKHVLTGSADATARLWDVETGSPAQILDGYKTSYRRHIESTAFSSDGTRVLIETPTEVRLWNVDGPAISHIFGGVTVTPTFSPDGRQVLTVNTDGKAIFWDAETGHKVSHVDLDKTTYSVSAAALSPSGRYILTGEYNFTDGHEKAARLWDAETGEEVNSFEGHSHSVTTVAWSPDGRWILTGGLNLRVWDADTFEEMRVFERPYSGGVAFSPDGGQLLTGGGYDWRGYDWPSRIWNVETGEETQIFDGDAGGVHSIAFSPDGRRVITASDDTTRLWDVDTGEQVRVFVEPRGQVRSLAFSPDGRQVLTGSSTGRWSPDFSITRLWDVRTGNEVRVFDPVGRDILGRDIAEHEGIAFSSPVGAVAFSPDGEQLLTGRADGKVWVWSRESGDSIRALEGHADWVSTITFSSDGSQLLTASDDGTARLWDVNSGEEIHVFKGHESAITAADFLPDDQHILTSSDDGTIRLWSVSTSEEKARMISLRDGSWLVSTPEGRFDAPDLERIRGAVWVAPDDPLTPLPIEPFMRDYYEPNLLHRILSGETFPEIKGLLERNRVQPVLEITDVEIASQDTVPRGTASVTVQATSVQRAYGGETRTSDVHDVRLFRNGQLVAWEDGVVATGTETITLRFDDIALPTAGADTVNFSAYAFNNDRVKSRTVYRDIALAARPERPRRAYAVSLGVDRFADPAWNLQFAANDAWQYQDVLLDGLRQSGVFADMVAVPLVAAHTSDRSTDARKEILQAVFDLLAGKEIPAALRARIPNADQIQEAMPDDLVLVTASTHGYTDQAGIFYLLPEDIPAGTGREVTSALLKASISSDDLTRWFRGVDAGDLVMVVDACHAAAAVEGTGFKPGPMGSRGLGQLAFNKGMRILTATQSADVALEVNELRHGLLSYALVTDGLRQSAADRAPEDTRITVEEWLAYGVDRVPELHRRLASGEPITDARDETTVIVRGIRIRDEAERFQRPSLFDFSKQRRDVLLREKTNP